MGTERETELQASQDPWEPLVYQEEKEPKPSWSRAGSVCNWDETGEGHTGGGPEVGGSPKEVPQVLGYGPMRAHLCGAWDLAGAAAKVPRRKPGSHNPA